jgi:hypothetical protein
MIAGMIMIELVYGSSTFARFFFGSGPITMSSFEQLDYEQAEISAEMGMVRFLVRRAAVDLPSICMLLESADPAQPDEGEEAPPSFNPNSFGGVRDAILACLRASNREGVTAYVNIFDEDARISWVALEVVDDDQEEDEEDGEDDQERPDRG